MNQEELNRIDLMMFDTLLNVKGAFDNPVSRRSHSNFQQEVIADLNNTLEAAAPFYQKNQNDIPDGLFEKPGSELPGQPFFDMMKKHF